MTEPNERAFRALLRWYPWRWRERHGDVVLGTMLDDAEARGIATPDASLRRAAMVDGLGARLDRRAAIVAASLAVAFGLAGIPLVYAGAGSAGLTTGLAAAPLLVLLANVAALRTRGILSAREALAACSVAIPTVTLTTLAALSWSVGFDEGDAGVARSWFAQALVWFAAAAWLTATAWGAVFLGGLLRTLAMPPAWARLGGAGCALVAYPFLSIPLINPATGALLALATLAAVILLTRKRTTIAGVARSTPPAARAARPPRPSVLICAAVSAVAGVGAVAFVLTGSGWTGGALDSTEAMGAGIVAGFAAGLPYCVAIGLMRSHDHRAINAWGPPSLIAVAFLITAADNIIGGGDGNRIVWALMIAALPLGGAVTWILAVGRWAPRFVQTTIAALCGASVLILGLSIQTLPFVLPIAALVLAVGEARRLSYHRIRRARPSRAAAA